MEPRTPHRRDVLRGIAGATLAGTALAAFPERVGALSRRAFTEFSIDGRTPDANGVILPEGFTARVVAISGLPVIGRTRWPRFPDGAAVFPTEDGGWIHTVNHEENERGGGGVTAMRYNADGEVLDAYPILDGTWRNCAGGPTPWGTWLSCEEWDLTADSTEEVRAGLVWECDPTGERPAVAHPAMGAFQHEAAAVDPDGRAVYMTEDQPDGRLYRYLPDNYPDLSTGRLQVAVPGAAEDQLGWVEVPDPSGHSQPVRLQVPEAVVFSGGEGLWISEGMLYITTKGDDRVQRLDVATQRITTLYEPGAYRRDNGVEPPLLGVDNVTVHPSNGWVLVAEDGGNLELVLVDPDGTVTPFFRLEGEDHDGSEITGPCFSPDGTRLFVSSQRSRPGADLLASFAPGAPATAATLGITYEITGPFPIPPVEEPAAPSEESAAGTEDGVPVGAVVGGGAAAVAAAIAAGVALRRRGREA